MLHPILIITHESDDSVKNAMQVLKDAGHTVKVLETPKSMLVDFLGALADVESEEADEQEKTAPEKTDAENSSPEKTAPEKTGDNNSAVEKTAPDNSAAEKTGESDMIEPKMEGVEAFIDGVKIDVYAGSPGSKAVIHPQMKSIAVESEHACKVSYQINEATFKQWVPSSDFTVTNVVALKRDDSTMTISAVLGESAATAKLVIDPAIIASMLG